MDSYTENGNNRIDDVHRSLESDFYALQGPAIEEGISKKINALQEEVLKDHAEVLEQTADGLIALVGASAEQRKEGLDNYIASYHETRQKHSHPKAVANMIRRELLDGLTHPDSIATVERELSQTTNINQLQQHKQISDRAKQNEELATLNEKVNEVRDKTHGRTSFDVDINFALPHVAFLPHASFKKNCPETDGKYDLTDTFARIGNKEISLSKAVIRDKSPGVVFLMLPRGEGLPGAEIDFAENLEENEQVMLVSATDPTARAMTLNGSTAMGTRGEVRRANTFAKTEQSSTGTSGSLVTQEGKFAGMMAENTENTDDTISHTSSYIPASQIQNEMMENGLSGILTG